MYVINNWKCLYQIISLLKRKFNDEHRTNYLGFLKLDLIPSDGKSSVQEGGLASMQGTIAQIDKDRFFTRIKQLLQRDKLRRKKRRERLKKKGKQLALKLHYMFPDKITRFKNSTLKQLFNEVMVNGIK